MTVVGKITHKCVTFLPYRELRSCNFKRQKSHKEEMKQEEVEETIIEHIIGSNKIWKMRKKVGDVSEQMMDRYRVCAPDALYNIENVLEERRKNAMGMREKYIEREC